MHQNCNLCFAYMGHRTLECLVSLYSGSGLCQALQPGAHFHLGAHVRTSERYSDSTFPPPSVIFYYSLIFRFKATFTTQMSFFRRKARPLGIACPHPGIFYSLLSGCIYRYQQFQFPLWYAAHLGTESDS